MADRFLVVIALSVALAVAVAALRPRQGSADGAGAASKPARIAFVDVGQGDGVVMKVGSAVVVSDAGEVHPENIEAQLRAFGRNRTIDVAILSHPHDDHVKDFIRLLEDGWRIKLAVRSESAHWQGTNTNRELLRLLGERNVPVELASAGMTFSWGGARWEILNPPAGRYTGGASQAGNASIAYLLTINGVQALFTGDVEPKVGRAIAHTLATRLERPIDIFLATHHGSKHGSVQELVDASRPRWAVLSVGRSCMAPAGLGTWLGPHQP
jgi:competence protein ComEC